MKIIITSLLALTLAVNVHAQDSARTISGVVQAADDATAVENVTVMVKGSERVSGTHPDGAFYIDVTKGDSVLIFRCEGFEKKEVRVTKKSDYKVILDKINGLKMEYRPLVKRTVATRP